MTDSMLVREFVERHDQAAFAQLVERHGGMVRATARRLAGDDADDVAQAVFVLLAQKAPRLVRLASVAGWLHETTRRCAANARRMRRRRQAHLRAAVEAAMNRSVTDNPDPHLLEQLDEALSRLPASQRQVLILRYLEDVPVEQTAQRLALSSAAVMKRSTRGLARLRAILSQRNVATSVEGLAGCMVGQSTAMTPAQHAGLLHVDAVSVAARKIAAAATGHLWATIGIAAMVTAALASAAALDHRLINNRQSAATPTTALLAPAAAPATTPLPTILPPPQGTVQRAADAFLAALRNRDVEQIARYLPGDDAMRRRLARQDIAAFVDGAYSRYPQRLARDVLGSSIRRDYVHGLLSATFDAASPTDADTDHLSLTIVPNGRSYLVNAVTMNPLNSTYPLARTIELTAPNHPPGFDFRPAQKSQSRFVADLAAIRPADSLQPSQLSALMEHIAQARLDLSALAAALHGCDLAPSPADVAAADNALADLQQEVGSTDIAAIRQRILSLEPAQRAAFERLKWLGEQIEEQVDARADAPTTDPASKSRLSCVDPDQQIWDKSSGQPIAVPGPLHFPPWLRETASLKRWQKIQDMCRIITADGEGNVYHVIVTGTARAVDGSIHEFLSEVQMYRPDRTLAEVTRWRPEDEVPYTWMTFDASGRRKIWEINALPRRGSIGLKLVEHYNPDGSGHRYAIGAGNNITEETVSDPIGEHVTRIDSRSGGGL